MPKRSISYLAAAVCIISTAHQARPNVIGHIDDLRACARTRGAVSVRDTGTRAHSDAAVSARSNGSKGVGPKAWRWIREMQEIAAS